MRYSTTRSTRRTARPQLWAISVAFDAQGETIGWQAGPVLGIAAHGLFENAAALRALLGSHVRSLEDSFEGLADLIDEHLGAARLRALFNL